MPLLDKFKIKIGKITKRPADLKTKTEKSELLSTNPLIKWNLVEEIGDGAFGKVYKARNRKVDSLYTAAKIIEKCTPDELEEYMIEVDILKKCKHKNIVELYESYYFDNKLWV
jgi:serine/threonine protein kinase